MIIQASVNGFPAVFDFRLRRAGGGPVAGRECYAGLDLSSTTDVSALVLVFPAGERYEVLPLFWVPEEGARRRERTDRVRTAAEQTRDSNRGSDAEKTLGNREGKELRDSELGSDSSSDADSRGTSKSPAAKRPSAFRGVGKMPGDARSC